MILSDQGVQYGSDDWQRFCRTHGIEVSMSRRGNYWDNSVAESFFSSLKKERVRNRTYRTREEARSDVFDYIEVSKTGSAGTDTSAALGPIASETAALNG
jgi:putative transposase